MAVTAGSSTMCMSEKSRSVAKVYCPFLLPGTMENTQQNKEAWAFLMQWSGLYGKASCKGEKAPQADSTGPPRAEQVKTGALNYGFPQKHHARTIPGATLPRQSFPALSWWPIGRLCIMNLWSPWHAGRGGTHFCTLNPQVCHQPDRPPPRLCCSPWSAART